MSGYGLGVIQSPGLFFYLGVTFITGTSTSIFVTFENRFFILFGQHSYWKHLRKPAIISSYILVPLYFLYPQFIIPDQHSVRQISWEMLDCIPELPIDGPELLILSVEKTPLAISISIAEGVPCLQCAVFFFLNVYHLMFARPTGVSRKTVQMQHKLVIALIIQSSVTVVLFLAPVNAIIAFVLLRYQNQSYNNLLTFALAIHGIASTLIMIFAHKPYRDFAFSSVFCLSRKPTSVTVRPSNIPSRNIETLY